MRIYHDQLHGVHIDLDSVSAVSDIDSCGIYTVWLKLHDKPLMLREPNAELASPRDFVAEQAEMKRVIELHKAEHAKLLAAWQSGDGGFSPLRFKPSPAQVGSPIFCSMCLGRIG